MFSPLLYCHSCVSMVTGLLIYSSHLFCIWLKKNVTEHWTQCSILFHLFVVKKVFFFLSLSLSLVCIHLIMYVDECVSIYIYIYRERENVCVCVCVNIYKYIYIYIYIYIYREREREWLWVCVWEKRKTIQKIKFFRSYPYSKSKFPYHLPFYYVNGFSSKPYILCCHNHQMAIH